MLYEFVCPECHRHVEVVRKVERRDARLICDYCGAQMRRVPSFSGALHTDHPVWLDKHCLGALQPPDEKPIETRGEHDRYCKERGIVQL